MYLKKPKVSPLFLSAVEEIRTAGYEPLPDEYIWLNQAAELCINGHDDGCPAFLQMPVRVGNCVLYPKTVGSSLWWINYASKWYEGQPEAELLCLAFMLAHARNPEVFESLTSKIRTDFAIVRWQISLSTTCTLEELAWAVNKVVGQHDYIKLDSPNKVKKPFDSSTDWGDIIARLCAAYKQRPEYFVWQENEQFILTLLAKIPSEYTNPSDDPLKKRYLSNFFEIKRHLKAKAKAHD